MDCIRNLAEDKPECEIGSNIPTYFLVQFVFDFLPLLSLMTNLWPVRWRHRFAYWSREGPGAFGPGVSVFSSCLLCWWKTHLSLQGEPPPQLASMVSSGIASHLVPLAFPFTSNYSPHVSCPLPTLINAPPQAMLLLNCLLFSLPPPTTPASTLLPLIGLLSILMTRLTSDSVSQLLPLLTLTAPPHHPQ